MRSWRSIVAAAAVALAGCESSVNLQLVPADDDFGPVAVGATSTLHQLTLTNSGPSSTDPLLVELTGGAASDFAPTEDACSGQSLPAGGSCHVRLTFTPGANGLRQAELAVRSGESAAATAALRGTGVDPATLRLTPSANPHNYGPVLAGGSGQTTIFSVINDGGVPGAALSVSISGTDASMFTLGNDRCTGQTVGPAASCTFAVTFRPPLSATGTCSAALQIGGGLSIGLTGNAIHLASLSWNPASHDYGAQPVGMDSPSGDFTFQLSNQGNLDTTAVTLSTTGAADFQLRATTCTGLVLVPGASCTATVRFVASTTGARQGSLVATAGAGAPMGVAADLDGIGQ